jgi:hypothetical protein
MEKKDLHHLRLHFDPLPKDLYKIMIKISTGMQKMWLKGEFLLLTMAVKVTFCFSQTSQLADHVILTLGASL